MRTNAEADGLWTYRRPSHGSLIELGTVRGRHVGLPSHFHEEGQLAFVLAGRRRIVIGNTEHCAEQAEGIYVPPRTPHRSLGESSDVLCLNLYLAEGCDVEAVLAELRKRRRRDGPELSPSFVSHVVEANSSPTLGPEDTMPPELPRNVVFARVRQAARAAGMSREGYSRSFRRQYGIPPDTYRLLSQLNLARHLLRTGQAIAAAAAEAGFSDQSHLGRCFRRAFGVTPGRYLKG